MIFVFPGQGSQKVGMGKDIYDNFSSAREVFKEVDESISFKLSELIFTGDENDLKSTENTQPALMAVSMAFVRVLEKDFGCNLAEKAKFFAGHSLGEYTALCASGAISLKDTARILRIRGKAMTEACSSGGAMAAILGLNPEIVEEIMTESSSGSEKVQIANDNSIGQVVISGHEKAVVKAAEIAMSRGARNVVMLPVSGPFHSELMKPAVDVLKKSLEEIEIESPSRPIIDNFTAKAETENFRDLLLKQITGRVRWRESILFAESQNVSQCVEIGSGKVLNGLVKRISPKMRLININSIESLGVFVNN